MTITVLIPKYKASEFEHALTVVMGYEIEKTVATAKGVSLYTKFYIKIKDKSDQYHIKTLADQFKN